MSRNNDELGAGDLSEDVSALEEQKCIERIKKAKQKQQEICERLKRKHSPNEVSSSHSANSTEDQKVNTKFAGCIDNAENNSLLAEDDEGNHIFIIKCTALRLLVLI